MHRWHFKALEPWEPLELCEPLEVTRPLKQSPRLRDSSRDSSSPQAVAPSAAILLFFTPRPKGWIAFLFLEGGGLEVNTSMILNSSVGVVMLSCVASSLGWPRASVKDQSGVEQFGALYSFQLNCALYTVQGTLHCKLTLQCTALYSALYCALYSLLYSAMYSAANHLESPHGQN